MDQKAILEMFRETDALLKGHFELRSGLHSNQFFQCAHLLQYPRIAAQVCGELAARVREELPDQKIETVISPAMGGISVGHEIARALGLRFIFAEKENDRLVMRRFNIEEGERFLVAEDVVTRGGRVRETLDIVRENGGEVAGIGVLVNRSGGKLSFDFPLLNLLEIEPAVWEPEECPLCAAGEDLVHPGS